MVRGMAQRTCSGETRKKEHIIPHPIIFLMLSRNGFLIIPCSVINAVMFSDGETSNAGAYTEMFSGAERHVWKWVISSALRSSIGMSSPDPAVRSKLEPGAAT